MSTTTLQMPDAIELNESTYSNTFGEFIIQPLERGFGNTIGNAFRRVLLSSLTGAAITSIKIDKVLHEFSTIPGVREDVSEIILNLKQVRFKLLNKKPEKITMDFKGTGQFFAGDISKVTNDFEVLNPDLLIATMDEDTDFSAEIRIGRGRGYVPAEENKMLDQPIGTIPVDSIFSPVLSVKYDVEPTRVGQKIDYEKLTMLIETDGSVTPDDALTYAGKILKDHIQLFINFDVEPEEEDTGEVDEEVLRIRKLLKMSVEELELSVRSHNCLKAANIKTIGDLVSKDEGTMLKFRNFGRKSLTELQKILEERNLHFGMDVSKYLKDNED
ncbi:MAG: DNA-directed RNA polymerase subunit alpha [bacterium]|nr:DNA-directed RNA polymerase subunit alpha [bacterium]